MRSVRRVVIGLVTVGLVYLGLALLTLAVGGTECDRGDCNFVGDAAADGSGKWVLAAAFLAVAIGAGVTAARALR
jgi:hypothetical protein